jgi:hypothetical protein
MCPGEMVTTTGPVTSQGGYVTLRNSEKVRSNLDEFPELCPAHCRWVRAEMTAQFCEKSLVLQQQSTQTLVDGADRRGAFHLESQVHSDAASESFGRGMGQRREETSGRESHGHTAFRSRKAGTTRPEAGETRQFGHREQRSCTHTRAQEYYVYVYVYVHVYVYVYVYVYV